MSNFVLTYFLNSSSGIWEIFSSVYSRYNILHGTMSCAPSMSQRMVLSNNTNTLMSLSVYALQTSLLKRVPFTNQVSLSVNPISNLLEPRGISCKIACIFEGIPLPFFSSSILYCCFMISIYCHIIISIFVIL